MTPPGPISVVLALDASFLRVGWGVVRAVDQAPIACGVFGVGGWITKKDDPRGKRGPARDYPVQVRRVLRDVHYAVEASMGGLSWEPAAIAVERPGGGDGGVETAVGLSVVAGSIAQAAQRRYADARPALYMPRKSEWQSVANVPQFRDPEDRRKLLQGNQRTSAVAEWLRDQDVPRDLGLEETRSLVWAATPPKGKPEVMARALLEGFRPPAGNQDAADAGLIALAVARMRASEAAA